MPNSAAVSERAFHERLDLGLGSRTNLLPDDLAVFDHEQGGDAADLELLRGCRALVDVHGRHFNATFELTRELTDERSDGATGLAPRGGEIHQHRDARLEHFRVEVDVVHVDYFFAAHPGSPVTLSPTLCGSLS